MKTFTYSDKKYYLNGSSGELKARIDSAPKGQKESAIFNMGEPVNIYFHKNLNECEYALSDAVSSLDGIIQPTKQTVRNAMIWTTGYDDDCKYSIKSGGETNSDSMYTSSLTVAIAHPISGLDTRVVLMKKYSSVFEDVLISESEVRGLHNMCLTKKEVETKRKNTIHGALSLLFDAHVGHKINVGGREVKAKESTLKQIRKILFENSDTKTIEKRLNQLIANKARYLNVALDETVSTSTTAEYHDSIRKGVSDLENFKTKLLSYAK